MRPQCNSDCKIAQRNARLAEALGIDRSPGAVSERTMATYSPELVAFARANTAFVKMVEKELANFVSSERAAHALPHMPEAKRSFVYNLAKVYRIDTRMIDVEPQRSVELIRRLDTRIPVPLLSSTLQAPATTLGKLQTSTSVPASPARSSTTLSASGTRAWAAVASTTSPALRPAPLNPATRPSTSITNSLRLLRLDPFQLTGKQMIEHVFGG
ncbi:SubName: Full=Uncharacterized protein {ECO:0000313/EMBL:CCA67475.1} [Serendipita indica DSM 11827]|nr:SubName: Full=Uncharacterized protein {ECO:0000313/EMBL:CCA67475.1} [Serendipita indica DSM 11827]